jgi:hypothetical protein
VIGEKTFGSELSQHLHSKNRGNHFWMPWPKLTQSEKYPKEKGTVSSMDMLLLDLIVYRSMLYIQPPSTFGS